MTRPKPTYRCKATNHSGFSLLQTSIILMMSAMVMVSLLPGGGTGDTNQKIIETIWRLDKVEEGMQRFMVLQGRRPCPADAIYDVNEANFGVEAGAVVANSPLGSCKGGTPAASMGPDATGYIVAGMIPTKTLALPDDYAFDAWGRRFAYYVDIRATTNASCYELKTGGLQVRTKDPTGAIVFTDSVMYSYLSHGPGGYGAWPASGSTLANRINTGIADSDKQANAGVNVLSPFTGALTNFTNTLTTKDKTASFDDLVYYVENYKNTCCVGRSCTSTGGFEGQGENTNDNNGTVVTTMDLNGDGLSDTVTCAPNASPGGRAAAGSVYVVFGTKSKIRKENIALSTIDGTIGTRFDGTTAGDNVCTSLASGDINGDNINDLIIGATDIDGGEGSIYVILGGTGAWPAACNLSALNGSSGGGNCLNGWRVKGEAIGDSFGASLAVKDFNGDDFDDILVGAPTANTNKGAAYIFCGDPGAWPDVYTANSITGIPASIPNCGIKLDNVGTDLSKLGTSVTMGNINGDVYSDAILGAPDATVGIRSGAGKVYSLCGGVGPFTTPVNMNALTGTPGTPGTCGTVFEGVGTNHHTGTSVSVGDINGDTITDVLIGAPDANPRGRANAGATYAVYGKETGFAATVDLGTLTQATTGYRIDGLTNDNSGTAVSACGDINGDGVDDIIIGAKNASPLARNRAGTVYVVFGAATALSTIDVTNLDSYSGIKIYGAAANDEAGTSVSCGDGYNFGIKNVIVGVPKRQIGVNPNVGSAVTVQGTHDWDVQTDIATLN